MDRLKKQINFIIEIDKLKTIFRQSLLADGSRHENDAEHSWHISLMCVILSEYAKDGTDVLKSIKMTLIHDLVEIYAGDTYLYDEKGNESKDEREKLSAEKLFSLLPDNQSDEIKALWLEFEEKKTKEAEFAFVMDRLEPVMLNYLTDGRMWKHHNVKKASVINKSKDIMSKYPELYSYFLSIVNESAEKGYLRV